MAVGSTSGPEFAEFFLSFAAFVTFRCLLSLFNKYMLLSQSENENKFSKDF